MKNKKSVLICFAILALLCLGIGFATLVDELTIDANVIQEGTSSEEHEESLFDIQFTGKSKVSEGSTTINVDIDTSYDVANDSAEFVVSGMKVENDTVTITYTIKNVECPTGYKAKVNLIDGIAATGTNNASFTKNVYFVDTENALNTSLTEVTLAKNDTATIKVVIKLTKTIALSTDKFNLEGQITLKATAVAA